MSFCFIILAAGNSLRFNSLTPKPYQKIGGKSLIEININKASKIKEIKKIVLVYNKKHIKYLKKLKLKKIKLIEGGNSRQMSTFKSLKYLFNHSKIKSVLIHDCARPNFSNELLQKLIKKKMKNKVVVPVIKIEDAIKQKIGNNNIQHIISKKRDDLFLTQTPQCFDLTEIYKLHKNKKDRYKDDDLSLFENFNDVKFIEGNKNNFKITDEQDFENAYLWYNVASALGVENSAEKRDRVEKELEPDKIIKIQVASRKRYEEFTKKEVMENQGQIKKTENDYES